VFGIEGDPDWRLRTKRRQLSLRYRAGVLGAVAALVALPYGEELVRCGRASVKRNSQLAAGDAET
jgi:hypothetical protein